MKRQRKDKEEDDLESEAGQPSFGCRLQKPAEKRAREGERDFVIQRHVVHHHETLSHGAIVGDGMGVAVVVIVAGSVVFVVGVAAAIFVLVVGRPVHGTGIQFVVDVKSIVVIVEHHRFLNKKSMRDIGCILSEGVSVGGSIAPSPAGENSDPFIL